MTLDELVAWIDAAMPQLPRARAARPRVKHVRVLYDILDNAGPDWELRREWHELAVKVAELLSLPHPDQPLPPVDDPPPRTPWHGPERPRKRESVSRAGRARFEKRPARRRAEVRQRETIEVNPQLQAAFDAVEAGRPIIFVTGGAGTGKSTFIRELRARFPEKQSVVLAPTGVAALTAGGQTIHSFCRLPLRVVMPGDARKADEPALVKAIDLLIIDEISMVRADVLDGIDAFLRLNRDSPLPFGGVQVVLVGDLFQLPPVVTPRDQQAIAEMYETPQFFSANALKGLKFFPVELEIVYRQSDASFASLLADIRDGSAIARAVTEINRHCVGRELHGRHLVLVPTRRAAATENDTKLEHLTGRARTFHARREGSFASASDDRLPAPEKLVVKEGAQVMFVRNDAERRWVNGTIGVIASMSSDSINVVVEDGTAYDVEPVEWQDVRYALDEKTKKIVEEIAGTYVQFPLIPAWAVTIHKAQGLTLERVVVDLASGAFAEGQVYVALSRCQTLEGLSLRRAVRPNEVRCSESAVRFYQRIRARKPRSGEGASATTQPA